MQKYDLGEAALAKSRLRARSASLGPVCHSPHIVFAMGLWSLLSLFLQNYFYTHLLGLKEEEQAQIWSIEHDDYKENSQPVQLTVHSTNKILWQETKLTTI